MTGAHAKVEPGVKQWTMTAAVTLWLTGCTFTVDMRSDGEDEAERAPDPFFVTAELFYPERIALPGDTEILVAVDAIDADGRTTLTQFGYGLGGGQVPIALRFSVEPQDAGARFYELSAAAVSGHRLLRLTGPILLRPGDGTAQAGRIRLHAPLETGFGQAWQCGSESLRFGTVGKHAFLALDDSLHALERVPTASGARYRARGDSPVGINAEGGEIMLIRDEETASECRRIAALEPPLSGHGNEPGWHVDIDAQGIELTSDYGQTVTRAGLIGTGSSGLSTHFRGTGENGPILATFRRALCRDSATGMPHPYSVEVQFEGGTLKGCGGRPRELLVGGQWRVTRIDDQPLPERREDGGEDRGPIEITLQFDEAGRVSGRAACNRYTAGFELGGEGLSITRPSATRMLCAEPLMRLEGLFLKRLSEVRRFDIGQQGELVLIAPEGRINAVTQGR